MENPLLNPQILPDDLILKICIYLPAKSIGRFRCVSKFFKIHLSQPNFIKTHLNRIKTNPNEDEQQHAPLLIISTDSPSLFRTYVTNAHQLFDEMTTTTTITGTKLIFADHPFETIIDHNHIASCDGLVLVVDVNDKLFVINPTTREIKGLAISPYAGDTDDSVTDNLYGFGFDSVNDDYKVVMISFVLNELEDDSDDDPDSMPMIVNVYSLKNGTWKRVENSPYDHGIGYNMSGVLVNGFVHWLACKDLDNLSFIVAFDFGSEKFHQVPPPSALESKKFVYYKLAALGGCLCLYPSAHENESDVWVMKEYGVEESWTKFRIIDTSAYEYKLLCSLGKELVVLAKCSAHQTLAVYNMKDGRKLKDIEIRARFLDKCRAGENYLETLVMPH